mmetsp:Transcript_13106/g.39557  ORF Transcript_13106/g.39557 Transcript_13106/m.39557 type:complete len:305 (+) Transcript_13106:64-978(+)
MGVRDFILALAVATQPWCTLASHHHHGGPRSCALWQVIDDSVSQFTSVDGNLNSFGLSLNSGNVPAIRGKLLMTFSGLCPASYQALEGREFTLSTSASEPVDLTHTEVKASTATINLDGITAKMFPTTMRISSSECTGKLAGAQLCFRGQVTVVALSGNAHVLEMDVPIADQAGVFTIEGFVSPSEHALGLEITELHAMLEFDDADIKGQANLYGYMATSAQLPFSFEGLTEESPAAPTVAVQSRSKASVAFAAAAAPILDNPTVVGALGIALFVSASAMTLLSRQRARQRIVSHQRASSQQLA